MIVFCNGETMLSKKKIIWVILLSVVPMHAFSVPVMGGNSEVPASNFKIVIFRAVWGELGTLGVIGEVKNTGNIAAGVELEATVRDANGNLVEVVKFWPNRIHNIPPKGSTGFQFPLTENKNATIVEMKVINARVW